MKTSCVGTLLFKYFSGNLGSYARPSKVSFEDLIFVGGSVPS